MTWVYIHKHARARRTQARRHAGTQARRHAGTQAHRHAGTQARRDRHRHMDEMGECLISRERNAPELCPPPPPPLPTSEIMHQSSGSAFSCGISPWGVSSSGRSGGGSSSSSSSNAIEASGIHPLPTASVSTAGANAKTAESVRFTGLKASRLGLMVTGVRGSVRGVKGNVRRNFELDGWCAREC